MVTMVGDPDATDLADARREGKLGHPKQWGRGAGGKAAGKSGKAGLTALIRIPDPNHEGLFLRAGKLGLDDPTWRWFRVKAVSPVHEGVVHAEVCQDVREAEVDEAARLEEAFQRGSFTLAKCYIGDELRAYISQ